VGLCIVGLTGVVFWGEGGSCVFLKTWASILLQLPRARPPTTPPTPPQKKPTPQPNIARYTTGVWTKAYLQQQLLVALAGRAGEELVFGVEELSSLNQSRLQFARQIAHKMLNAGMSAHPDFENLRTLGHNYMDPSMEPSRWGGVGVGGWGGGRGPEGGGLGAGVGL